MASTAEPANFSKCHRTVKAYKQFCVLANADLTAFGKTKYFAFPMGSMLHLVLYLPSYHL